MVGQYLPHINEKCYSAFQLHFSHLNTANEHKAKKGSHQCKVGEEYGHRWCKCKYGDSDDISALLAKKWALYSLSIIDLLSTLLYFFQLTLLLFMHHRGPPKKRKKIIEPSCESSIVPVGLAPKTMHFPPMYDLHTYILKFFNKIPFILNLTYLLQLKYPS